MKREELYKITRFYEEKGVDCVSETIVSARSLKDAMAKALEENEISVTLVTPKPKEEKSLNVSKRL